MMTQCEVRRVEQVEGGERRWRKEEGVLIRVGSWDSGREAGTERVEHKQTSPKQMGGVRIIIRRNIVRIPRKWVVGLRLGLCGGRGGVGRDGVMWGGGW